MRIRFWSGSPQPPKNVTFLDVSRATAPLSRYYLANALFQTACRLMSSSSLDGAIARQ